MDETTKVNFWEIEIYYKYGEITERAFSIARDVDDIRITGDCMIIGIRKSFDSAKILEISVKPSINIQVFRSVDNFEKFYPYNK